MATVMVCGATSQVGRLLLGRLLAAGLQVLALSRQGAPAWAAEVPGVRWLTADIGETASLRTLPAAEYLIHLAPLPVLPPALPELAALGVRRVVAFSTSSRLSKARSPVPAEQQFAQRLALAEEQVAEQSARLGMAWTVFRPTLIYGCNMDRNVSLIRRLIRRFRFFPLLGEGRGLRQPVHADDLAAACVAALEQPASFAKYYELGGAEVLSYRAMVERIFAAEALPARFIRIPVSWFAALLRLLALLPRYRDFNVAMAQRMNEDLVYDHAAAQRDFGYRPRRFTP